MSSTLRIDKGISAQQLEKMIDDAPKGTIFEFSEGNYEFDDTLTITRSDVTLKGEGSGKTTLIFTDRALDSGDDYAIQLNGSDSDRVGTLANDVDEGEHRITLDSAHGLEPGDTLRLWQDNDSAFFDEIGDTAWRKDNSPLRTSMARVESTDGNTVTLDRGVHFDFEDGKTRVERLDVVNDVVLQGFGIEFELGTPDNGTFGNTQTDLKDFMAVYLNGTVDSKLEDIQVINGPSIAYHFAQTLDNHVNDIQAHGAFNKGSGGNGYAYELRESYDGDYTNLADSGMRHSLLFASWRSSVGNDIHVRSTDRDINFHGGRDHDNRVQVDQSIRGADDLSTSLWINDGNASYGAITEADANQVTFEYLVGSRRDDVVQGSDDGAYLNGGLGNDTLRGGQGDDILQGGPANDWGKNILDGGEGDDTAYYLQDYDESDIHISGDTVRVNEDTLHDIEQVAFGDGTVLDVESGRTSQEDTFAPPNIEEILDTSFAPRPESEQVDDNEVTVSGRIKSEWDDGYVAEIFIANNSDEKIADPEVQFDLPDDLDIVWNGVASEDDDSYRINDDSSSVLDPGEVWRFAYRAYGDDLALPSEMSVQGNETQAMQVPLLGIDASQAAEYVSWQ
ncbi:cellulose binding domain-containing protein [Halomonas sp. McH1-25]|uniref:cellulose binding domain-containing protein n=1 Tax=unclassified Halomonas TaxID=2609666 RepID=UPI001EF6942E|nr:MULTISPECIES: cellulose binding domain-containing protein [unclassified Halomonas]MCG7600995.1 cellulose binding domain-containing protein [Halomonas sp. McH1-25]MCP1342086.1 cellulose binding domain-containing protein [Halomonas sp. FL8]MCP1359732.1 cellulose binding domain-containing protein [Halomonas sp. BBD45]MCP1364589.1 cellulose binding domain-containing protein [Halomonas sp. BBD48]